MLQTRPILLDASGRVAAGEYALFAGWWNSRHGSPPALEMLPGCGVVVEEADGPVAVAFMYLDATGSGVAWLGWMASDPLAGAATACNAVELAVQFLEDHARALNYWLVVASYNRPSLVAAMVRAGFQAGETNFTHLFKPLS